VSNPAFRHWPVRPTSPRHEPTRTLQSSDPDTRTQTPEGPRHPTEANVSPPAAALVSTGQARGSATVYTAAAKRAISEGDCAEVCPQSRYGQQMAGEGGTACGIIDFRSVEFPETQHSSSQRTPLRVHRGTVFGSSHTLAMPPPDCQPPCAPA
jgi:hypothetical protein